MSPDRRRWLRVRQVVNLANGSTLAGLGVAALGCAATTRSADGLFTGVRYRLPVPPAPAFCLGNVIMTRGDGIDPGSALFRHEARHATQFACCGGVTMIPLYLAAAGVSYTVGREANAQYGEGFNHWLNVTVRATRSAQVRHWWAARGIIVSRLMRVRFGPVHLSRELPRGHSRAMLASERNALINEIDAAQSAVEAAKLGPAPP